MFSLLLNAREGDDRDLLIAELWEAGASGITEEAGCVRAFFEEHEACEALADRFCARHPVVEKEEPVDWVRFAQDQWQPFPVGERFFLVPEWREDPAPEGRLRLIMRPGMACGSGTHPATRLCLMAIERSIASGDSVLDVGTGAGILADAALLLGAASVFGCDIEHDSTLVARANLPERIRLFTGSVRCVRTSAVDWAVCNLNAATLQTLAPELLRIASGLILSGFREDELADVIRWMERQSQHQFELEGYACIVLRS